MSDIDTKALEALFENWRKDRAPQLKASKAFERFVIEQVLKNLDPSDEDIESGDLGERDDGGVDSMYLVMNGTVLISEEVDPPEPTTSVELVIIQAKNEGGFGEMAIERLISFCNDLLDYSKEPGKITYLNSDVRDAIRNFRNKYDKVYAAAHTMKVSLHYATRATQIPSSPSDKVIMRVENLKKLVRSKLTQAAVEFDFWGCSRLLASARALPQNDETVVITKSLSADDGSVVCLVGLKEFAKFLTDDGGRLKTSILEPNVRDYQGQRNQVNSDIRETLTDSSSTEEFWWLNNGVTILATACGLSGNKLKISDPEVVNGLQTSHELFGVFARNPDRTDNRSILVRVVLLTDDRSRNKVIKATNSQTPVDAVSLRATDRIHFDIEDKLKLYGLFYDRKKGKYRRLRKPIADIVSIKALAQAVMAVFLQRPDDARGRPKSLLTDKDVYGKLFDDSHNRDLFVACISLDRQVDAFLDDAVIDGAKLTRDERRNIRYYMDALVACELIGLPSPDAGAIAAIVAKCVAQIPIEIMQNTARNVLAVYRQEGGTDNVAKGKKMWPELAKLARSRFPGQPHGQAAGR